MDIELQLRRELAAQDPGPNFTAGVMARVKGHWRSRGRVVLFSAILVAGAAAAAILRMQLAERPADPALATLTPPTLEAVDAHTPAVSVQDDMTSSSGNSAAVSRASEVPTSAVIASNSFIVAVSALRHESESPANIAAAESFYRAFMLELRKIPEIVVVGPGEAAQYRIAVTGRSAPATPAAYIAGYNAVGVGTIKPGSSRWQVQVAVQSSRLEKGIYVITSTSFFPEDCLADAKALAREAQLPGSVCAGPTQIAWAAVQDVRRGVFPGATRPLTMTAAYDADMLEMSTRHEASHTKEALVLKGRDNWDATDIRAIVDSAIAEKDPVRRLDSWNRLRGVRNPAAAPLIITALREDPDARVRLGALQLLLDYSADPTVSVAIEVVGLNDKHEILRQLARKVIAGGTNWHNSVSANLRDTSLPDDVRLQQLLFIADSSDLASALPALVDANAATALGDLLPRMSVYRLQAADATRILKLFAGSEFLRWKLMANAVHDPDPAARAAALSMVKTLLDENPGFRTAMENSSAVSPEMQILLEKLRALEAVR